MVLYLAIDMHIKSKVNGRPLREPDLRRALAFIATVILLAVISSTCAAHAGTTTILYGDCGEILLIISYSLIRAAGTVNAAWKKKTNGRRVLAHVHCWVGGAAASCLRPLLFELVLCQCFLPIAFFAERANIYITNYVAPQAKLRKSVRQS